MRMASRIAKTTLNAAAVLWCSVAAVGQLLFAAYIGGLYGGAVVTGDLARWNKVLPHSGYIPGDTWGNIAIGSHVLVAVVIIVGGLLQLLPWLRRRLPKLHRWNGRMFAMLAVLTSMVGLYMLWFRGGVGGVVMHIGMSVDAILIGVCAFKAVTLARARDFAAHRRWALRLLMVVSAVWFYRLGLMFWIVVNRGPVGFDPVSFRGPFLDILSFAQYLLPLAALECYLRAQENGSAAARIGVAAGIAGLTTMMGVGVFAAAIMMWLPRM
jgi:hypothetical protein